MPGLLTLRVEATLWTAVDTTPVQGEVQAGSLGWTMHGGKLRAINPDLKVGGTYLVAFASFKSGLAPMRPISVEIVGGKVSSSRKSITSSSGEWVSSLDGLSVDEIRLLFAQTAPDAVANQFAGLAVEDQIAAVRQARAATP